MEKITEEKITHYLGLYFNELTCQQNIYKTLDIFNILINKANYLDHLEEDHTYVGYETPDSNQINIGFECLVPTKQKLQRELLKSDELFIICQDFNDNSIDSTYNLRELLTNKDKLQKFYDFWDIIDI